MNLIICTTKSRSCIGNNLKAAYIQLKCFYEAQWIRYLLHGFIETSSIIMIL